MSKKTDRRDFIAKSVLGISSLAAAGSLEERAAFAAIQGGEGVSQRQKAEATKEPMPYGMLGKAKISRLILGSNLIGGFAHSRDLIYVSKLFKSYNTDEKIFETFELAEQTGINAIMTSPPSLKYVGRYNKERGGKLQAIVYIRPHEDAKLAKTEVDAAIDQGACAISTHGGVTDKLVRDGNLDPIFKTLELIKKHGVAAGVGGHSLLTTKAAEENELGAQFYHKTFHSDRYWSATPKDSRKEWCWYLPSSDDHDAYKDNMFCLDPEETAAFMAKIDKPWIAFKVLAAGAIHPRRGFSHAFRKGADFVCCGMFDFQVCEDAKLAKQYVRQNQNRDRAWMA